MDASDPAATIAHFRGAPPRISQATTKVMFPSPVPQFAQLPGCISFIAPTAGTTHSMYISAIIGMEMRIPLGTTLSPFSMSPDAQEMVS